MQALDINPAKAKKVRILPAGSDFPHLSPKEHSSQDFRTRIIIPRLLESERHRLWNKPHAFLCLWTTPSYSPTWKLFLIPLSICFPCLNYPTSSLMISNLIKTRLNFPVKTIWSYILFPFSLFSNFSILKFYLLAICTCHI